MNYEKLALEVGATVAGLTVTKPPFVKGASGIDQKFSFVASDGPTVYGFDLYPEVGQAEILRTYMKKMDTGAETFVVCLSGSPCKEARDMARFYGIDILDPSKVGDFFSRRITEKISARGPALVR